ncbi:MAG TPA: FG-GAP-like repeat-containing protein, partial [Gemmatimonadales bacterium]|nr:FG-GAP-like repeat-containing protein [Gemmatimonadales bacterium]
MSLARRAWLGAALLANCGRAAPPAAWHEETGYRWRELASPGGRPDGFTRLAARSTGIDFANSVSDSASYRNRHLMHGSGVAIGDVNGDGRPDVYLCRIEGPNALYLNQGGWRFREAARAGGVALGDRPSTGAVFADVDDDGDLDLVVTSMGGRNSLFLNDGKGVFQDATVQSGFVAEERGSTTAALADVDGDGDLDLYVANYKARTMLDSLSPQQRAFDQVVKQTAGRFEVIAGAGDARDVREGARVG